MEVDNEVSGKRLRRLESKKKKLRAFLDLIRSDVSQNDQISEETAPSKIQGNSRDPTYGKEDVISLKRKLKENGKLGPEIILNTDGVNAQLLGFLAYDTSPIFVNDIKNLLYSLTQHKMPCTRWCTIVRSHAVSEVIVVIVNNLSSKFYYEKINCFPRVNALSPKIFDVVAPLSYGMNLTDELCFIPKGCTKNIGVEMEEERNELVTCIKKCARRKRKVILKTDLLLSLAQMVIEKYPFPCDECHDYCFTKAEYKDVSSSSPLFGLDCEMVMTVENKLELVHISIVDENLNIVYNSYVRPEVPIKDYLTKFSGVTKATLEGVTTTLADVQKHIQQLLPQDAILCGQSLNFDLHVLKMIHPYIIDTSVIYNISGSRIRKKSLKTLSKMFLGKEIQCGDGHSPVEDSIMAVKLVLLKLQQGLEFGDVIACSFQTGQDNVENSLPKSQNDGEKMLIAGNDQLLNWYVRQHLTGQVDLLKVEENELLVKRLQDSSCRSLTFCTLKNEIMGKSEETIEESLFNLDETISNIYDLCKTNALFIVVAEGYVKDGSSECENGLCMMMVKIR